jgi:superfamily II DNA or RNA helicase
MTQQSSRFGVHLAGIKSQSPTGPPKRIRARLETAATEPAAEPLGRAFWLNRLRDALAEQSPQAHQFADEGLQAWPTDPEMLILAALTSLAGHRPERALALIKRYGKRYVPGKPIVLLTALAYAQQKQFARAWTMLEADHLHTDRAAMAWFVGDGAMENWLLAHLREIRVERSRSQSRPKPRHPAEARPASTSQTKPAPNRGSAPRSPPARATGRDAASLVPTSLVPRSPGIPDLPRQNARFNLSFEVANPDAIEIAADVTADPVPFRLRGELVRLSLFEGFDELLCLPALQGVEAHWYQIETVRKVLKQYRGRVLLADEVGLGKTIEAGMVLKEYILRGMAERVLILTPASLVGQWRDEMASKFGIDCATSHDPLLRSEPASFWAQPRVIASIAVARRKDQAEMLTGLDYDVVIVDEAHHLRDQASASYRLVNSLQKRFLLLLSATPVQNSLLELYNLLTLLQPGIFKTQKEFRSVYMVPGKPREPANRERLRDLMRSVMVRNTRALAALRMPRRQASTLRAVPDPAEAACYQELSTLVREVAAIGSQEGNSGPHRLSLQHVLAAAGSSPAAASRAIGRIAEHFPGDPRWSDLVAQVGAITAGAKEVALFRLLAQNPAEKKLVFVHHRESLAHLADRLGRQKIPFALFSGDMSGPQKDAAVDAFRDRVPLLLCTESGGEGRNLQFCNTLINFDIPWNPMAIEQRIGRIDRIGQSREVFIFNLVTADTIEDAVLRILDEKINMFELVVGEVGAILGEIDEQQEFSTLVLDAWLQGTEQARAGAFAQLEDRLRAARRDYEGIKQLDEALFGNELDAA